MKQPKKLTRDHKEYLLRHNLDPKMWMLQSEDDSKWVYVNKIDGSTRQRIKYNDRGLKSTQQIIDEFNSREN